MKYDSFRCNWLFIKQNQKHKHNKLAMSLPNVLFGERFERNFFKKSQ